LPQLELFHSRRTSFSVKSFSENHSFFETILFTFGKKHIFELETLDSLAIILELSQIDSREIFIFLDIVFKQE